MSQQPLTTRLRQLRDALLTGLVERDVTIRLALIAALAGEHLLLVGPPGTAKSHVARRLHLAFSDSSYFERLLTRFSVPEELFGPLSIKGLEDDRYERLTANYLPTASIAFLDEIFKANSAILNALLTLLNEREFDNGTHRNKAPLISVIGASNELPEGEELDALFDRFLLRLHVGPVTQDGFKHLLDLQGESTPEIPADLKLSEQDLQQVKAAIDDILLPDDIRDLLGSLRQWCMAESIQVSDRRWRKVVKLLKVSAMTNGHDTVSIWDCWLLQHCLWNNPEDKEKIYQWYVERVGASRAKDPEQLTRMVVAWEAQLVRDEQRKSQAENEEGALLYKNKNGEVTTQSHHRVQARRNNQPLFLAPDCAYSGSRRIADRTNGGKGYTYSELKEFSIDDRQWGRYHDFESWRGKDAYLANSANHWEEDQGLAPLLEPIRHKPAYIDDVVRNIDAISSEIEHHQAALKEHMQELEERVLGHLWITEEFTKPAAESLQKTEKVVKRLLERTGKLRNGFQALPLEEIPELVIQVEKDEPKAPVEGVQMMDALPVTPHLLQSDAHV